MKRKRLVSYREKRPTAINTNYDEKEVKRIFFQRYELMYKEFYHICNGKGYIHYDSDGNEAEYKIVKYYDKMNGSKDDITPFDLMRSDDIIRQLKRKQVRWEKQLARWR